MKIEAVKFMLMVQDMDRALAFWRDIVGLEVRMSSPHWSELTHGDAVVALHGGGSGERTMTGLSIQVDDIDAAADEVAAGGATVEMPPEDRPGEPIKLGTFMDPEGNVFGLTQYVG